MTPLVVELVPSAGPWPIPEPGMCAVDGAVCSGTDVSREIGGRLGEGLLWNCLRWLQYASGAVAGSSTRCHFEGDGAKLGHRCALASRHSSASASAAALKSGTKARQRARRGTQPCDNLSHTCERSSTCQMKHMLFLCYGTRQNHAEPSPEWHRTCTRERLSPIDLSYRKLAAYMIGAF